MLSEEVVNLSCLIVGFHGIILQVFRFHDAASCIPTVRSPRQLLADDIGHGDYGWECQLAVTAHSFTDGAGRCNADALAEADETFTSSERVQLAPT